MKRATDKSSAPAAANWFTTRGAVLAAGAVGFLAVLFLLAGPSWAVADYRLVTDGVLAVLWLIGAAGIGRFIVRMFVGRGQPFADGSTKAVTAAAMGLGILSIVILLLGLAGYLTRVTAVALLLIGWLLAAPTVRQVRWDSIRVWLSGRAAWWHWLLVLATPLAAMSVLGALFPAGVLWRDEPHRYDVVEYHLQVPREWYEAGKILPLHHNVFSYFPFNVEMHYLLAMHLRGGPWAGMFLAQLMHAAFCGLTIVAIYALAGRGRRGALAAALAAGAPWMAMLGAIAYNEGGMLLWSILAIGWAARARRGGEFALAGIFAGFAAGAKLAAVLILFVGIPAALLICGGIARPTLLKRCALFVFCGVATLSPWLIRNACWTGNPVFPEAMNLLGKADFSDVQVKRWEIAYRPDQQHASAVGHLVALRQQVVTDFRYGWLLLPLAVIALALSWQERSAAFLGVLLLLQTAFWLLATHLQGRFMVIAIPLAAWLIVQYDGRLWTALSPAAAAIMIVFATANVGQRLWPSLKDDRQLGLIGREGVGFYGTFDRLPPDTIVDLVGNAGAFLYHIPMSRLHYKTVFDVDTSDRAKSIEQDWLAGMPSHAIIVRDDPELHRFAKTYWGVPDVAEAATTKPK
ncbi:MAG: hypothetical protein ABR964_02730 [Tepidisphaeraceae bacterium]